MKQVCLEIMMKSPALILIFGFLSQLFSTAAEGNEKPLKLVPFDLKHLGPERTHKYKWVSVTQKGAKREAKDYGTLVTSTKLTKEKIVLHDTISTVTPDGSLVFERRMEYPTNSLLKPERISLDIKAGDQSTRVASYEKGELTWVSFSGTTNREHVQFDDGIVTLNTLLRLAPLLPREIGNVYTFRMHAEQFLFRIHESKEKDPPFTLTCCGSETVKIGKKSYPCVWFRMDLKPVEIRTDFWV